MEGKEIKVFNYTDEVNKFNFIKEHRPPTWVELLKDNLMRLFVGILACLTVYVITFGFKDRGNKITYILPVAIYLIIRLLLDIKRLLFLNLYDYEGGVNSELATNGIDKTIRELDSLVFIIRKDIINRKNKDIKVFNSPIKGLEPDMKVDFIVNMALNRYLDKDTSIKDMYSLEFDNWYRVLKIELDKVGKINE